MLQSLLILFGLVAGALTGHLVFDPNWTQQQPLTEHAAAGLLQFCHFIGFTVFIGLLKMLIVPLVATSVVVGILSVGDFQKLGKLGFWTVVYYLVTMLLAVLTGLLLVNVLEPGRALAGAHALPSAVDSLDAAGRARADAGVMGVCIHLIEMLIPENVFASMAAGDTLSVIAFFIFFAVVASSLGSKAEPVTQFAEALFQILMKMVQIVLWLAPLGVWALLCWSVARVGLGVFGESIGQFMITVLLGLVIHGVVTLPLLLLITTRSNPLRFAHQMRQALLTAFSTDSSSATLPVTLECATEQAGISRRAAGLVLPLGSTVNMDGTALYEAVAVVFLAQVYGIELSITQLLIVTLTATLAAIGAAGIPSAGLVTLVIVIEAVNQSLVSGNSAAPLIPVAGIGILLGVDRLLDMVRTMINVWGDAVGAKIIGQFDV